MRIIALLSKIKTCVLIAIFIGVFAGFVMGIIFPGITYVQAQYLFLIIGAINGCVSFGFLVLFIGLIGHYGMPRPFLLSFLFALLISIVVTYVCRYLPDPKLCIPAGIIIGLVFGFFICKLCNSKRSKINLLNSYLSKKVK